MHSKDGDDRFCQMLYVEVPLNFWPMETILLSIDELYSNCKVFI